MSIIMATEPLLRYYLIKQRRYLTMDRYVKGFIIMSVVYLGSASVLGIGMMLYDELQNLRFVHSHFMLLGWVSMMIYGVGYHILPRFSGVPLWSDKLAVAHIFTANIGLLGMIAGWTFKETVGYGMLHGFAMIEGLSVIFFALNMFKTIRAVSPPPKKA